MWTQVGHRVLGRETTALLRDPRVLTLCGAFTTAIMYGALLSPALPAISDHFPGATEANIGLVLTVQTVAIVISLPLVGILADNVGARRILPFSLGLYALFGMGCALAPSYTALLALRALQGIAYSGIIPIVTSVVSRAFEGDAETAVQGLLSTSTGVAGILYPVIGGLLVSVSWRAAFLFYGCLLPIGFLAYGHLADQSEPPPSKTIGFKSVFSHLRYPHAIAFLLGFTIFFLRLSIVAYLPFLAIDAFGATPLEIGALLTAVGVLKTVSSSQIMRLRQWVPVSAQIIIGIGAGAAGSSLAWLGFSHSFASMLVGLSFFGIAYGITLPLNRSLLTTLTGPEFRSTTFAFLSVTNNLGKTVAPIIIGGILVMGHSVHTAFTVVGAGALLVGLAFVVNGVIHPV